MSTSLGRYLIFNHNSGHVGSSVPKDSSFHIDGIPVPRVAICNARDDGWWSKNLLPVTILLLLLILFKGGTFQSFRYKNGMIHHFLVRYQLCIGITSDGTDTESSHKGCLKACSGDQPCRQSIVTTWQQQWHILFGERFVTVQKLSKALGRWHS